MSDAEFPEELKLSFKRAEILRYGENPHQQAALYVDETDTRPSVARARKVQGKELSYNNLMDADAAFECVAEFEEPAAVIVKHMNPCGVSLGRTPHEAYRKAYTCDPVSSFGGIVALNRELDVETAQEMAKIFLEVVVAPTASEEVLKIFSAKPNVRVLLTGSIPDRKAVGLTYRTVAGGLLVQSRDNINDARDKKPWVVTKREPTKEEWNDLKFAFEVVKHVKSNAIVYAKNGATVGIGAGQMSRIYSAKIAAMKAEEVFMARGALAIFWQGRPLPLQGAVMASDAFMPFSDCVEAAHEAGATAIIQPGGSLKDQDSIDAADKYGMAMVFTGVRHFRH